MIHRTILACLIFSSAYSFVVDYVPRNFYNPNDPNDKVLRSKEVKDCLDDFDDVITCVSNQVVPYIRSTDYSAWAQSGIDVPGFDVTFTGKSGTRKVHIKKNCWSQQDTKGQFSFKFFWESNWSTSLCLYSYSCAGKRISGTYDLYSRFVSYGKEVNEAMPENKSGKFYANNFTGEEIKIKTDPFFVKSSRMSEPNRVNENPSEFVVNSTITIVPRLNQTEFAGRFAISIVDEASDNSKDNEIKN